MPKIPRGCGGFASRKCTHSAKSGGFKKISVILMTDDLPYFMEASGRLWRHRRGASKNIEEKGRKWGEWEKGRCRGIEGGIEQI